MHEVLRSIPNTAITTHKQQQQRSVDLCTWMGETFRTQGGNNWKAEIPELSFQLLPTTVKKAFVVRDLPG
jgi:hypothetical protein